MKYILKKGITLIITLFIVSIFTFTMFQVIPGDSALSALGMSATEQQLEDYREAMGLNKSLPIRYGIWLSKAITGDFGTSVQYKMPVSQLIRDRLPVTIWLAVISFILIIIVSLPLGIVSAKKKNHPSDHVITTLTQVSMAIPAFFLGMILSYIFGVILKWFTPGKYVSYSESFTGFLSFMIFPAIAIAIPKIAMLVKFLRSSILRQMKLDYVRTARSKGMKEQDILYKHVLKNALIPVITFLAMMLADIMAGAILIEQVFNLPGLGRTLLVAISNRDFNVVQAIILYIATVVIGINFAVDLLYQRIDPRVNVKNS
ncbi:ABC transporter permease [Lachnospiraceae bacterium MD1]|jgi:peptide/nickel transport system permease protein/oligopeptide transport system permease protein|uniref:ABC transporter permease n=1 Tax=Variimorphobacter saccharofermentans TaxID=2755051 RepID=A0A839JXD2_9FIRM|nr:ABC transporter permease [Variimorphobacter saccharofermentans]MBB2181642.1 ABC transporter permease [Variimorphobacter saccharofermentans]